MVYVLHWKSRGHSYKCRWSLFTLASLLGLSDLSPCFSSVFSLSLMWVSVHCLFLPCVCWLELGGVVEFGTLLIHTPAEHPSPSVDHAVKPPTLLQDRKTCSFLHSLPDCLLPTSGTLSGSLLLFCFPCVGLILTNILRVQIPETLPPAHPLPFLFLFSFVQLMSLAP